MREIPQACIDFIKVHEGCVLTAYQDAGGVWTIGFGSAHNVLPGETITEAQADALLAQDVQTAADALAKVVDPDVLAGLTDNQFSALVDFAFNLGTGTPPFPIWKVVNAKEYDQVPSRMMLYVNAGGKKLQGLVDRRADEAKLWGTDEPGSAPVVLSSSVTRTMATPATPLDPHPRGITTAAAAAAALATPVVANLQNVAKTVTDVITPYASGATIFQHLVGTLTVVGGGCALGLFALKYVQDRSAKSWGKSTAPALHPAVLKQSESNLNPLPPGATTVSVPPVGLGGAAGASVSTVLPAAPTPAVPSGAGSTITSDLADLRAALGRCLAKLTGEAESFAGKTVSEIIAEAKKLAASVESKL